MAGHDHAVVAGAGIAGLLTARVLSDTYRTVSIIERDTLPDEAGARRGVPQSHHAHGLLAKGFEILEDLFPGLREDLLARGAMVRDAQADVRWINDGHRMAAGSSDLPCLLISRPALEHYLRTRVAALPGVEIRQHCEVLEPVAERPGGPVTAVRLLRVNAEPELLPSDLFVDATGRGNRGETWLAGLGYGPAPEERIDSGLVYSSREYRHVPGDLDADAVIIGAQGSNPRGGVALRAEGDRWLVTLFGLGGNHPAGDPDGYLEFARTLPAPDLHELLQRLEPLGPPRRMRIPVSIRRRYERLTRFPEGYLVIGDALCQFNPSYGQGMTVAAREAAALRDCLTADPGPGLARRFFRHAAKITDVPWDMSVGGDLRFPSVQGRRTARVRFLNGYIARLHRAAADDPAVAAAFLGVANLRQPPQALFAPSVLRSVLRRRPQLPPPPAPEHPAAPPLRPAA
ncbi:FAD-binding monooxygenase [Kitasatospora terrestris]|uniref:FAD-binding monooxygenase n=1 Tax=Kitasatospora terrestris TaxID=258051 RepID=A0ABP9EJA7_9ACTN